MSTGENTILDKILFAITGSFFFLAWIAGTVLLWAMLLALVVVGARTILAFF